MGSGNERRGRERTGGPESRTVRHQWDSGVSHPTWSHQCTTAYCPISCREILLSAEHVRSVTENLSIWTAINTIRHPCARAVEIAFKRPPFSGFHNKNVHIFARINTKCRCSFTLGQGQSLTKPEPCPLPNVLVTAAVCSTKTYKQLYRGGRFWSAGVVHLVIGPVFWRRRLKCQLFCTALPQIFSSRTAPAKMHHTEPES